MRISDIILGFWMIAIAFMFSLNIGRVMHGVTEDTWIYSLPISLNYPAFLYLHAKYLTSGKEKFQLKDYWHFSPSVFAIFVIFLFRNPEHQAFYWDLGHYEQITCLRNILGTFYILALWSYGFIALKHIIQFRRKIKDLYSFKSNRISLSWLIFVTVSFILVNNIIIIANTLEELNLLSEKYINFKDVPLLIFVYIVGIWGFRQDELITKDKSVPVIRTSESGKTKYQKSGLNEELARNYLNRLLNYMETSEAWKNPKLSIAILSSQTNIQAHHITQVLNEYLKKNFYVFVNEYRTEFAKQLINNPEND